MATREASGDGGVGGNVGGGAGDHLLEQVSHIAASGVDPAGGLGAFINVAGGVGLGVGNHGQEVRTGDLLGGGGFGFTASSGAGVTVVAANGQKVGSLNKAGTTGQVHNSVGRGETIRAGNLKEQG